MESTTRLKEEMTKPKDRKKIQKIYLKKDGRKWVES